MHYGWLGICAGNFVFEVEEGKQYILDTDTGREPIEMVFRDKKDGVIVASAACMDTDTSKP